MDAASILLAAASALGAGALEESAKLAVAEVWSALKSAVKRKHGADSTAFDVIDEVERLPPDTEPSRALGLRVEALGLADDPDIAAVLQRMETLLKERVPGAVEKQYNFFGGVFNNANFS